MKVRAHDGADHAAIVDLRWCFRMEEAHTAGPVERKAFDQDYRHHLEARDRAGDTVHWLLDDAGSILGIATVRTVLKEPDPGDEKGGWGYLTNVYVRPEVRNRGHGTRLLTRAIEDARGRRLELLVVWPSERSYPLYRRLGFVGRDDPLQLAL